jgi:magnesium chelatase family protein
VATPDDAGRKLLAQAAETMRLSARAVNVGRIHLAEALSYRRQAPRN